MKKIAITSEKGGSAKTTIALNIAVEASLDGQRVLVVDMDPQESAFDWGEDREADWPAVIKGTAGGLSGLLAQYDSLADLVIMDLPPHAGSVIDVAIGEADLVLAPVRPGRFDIKALPTIETKVAKLGKKGRVVLTHCRSRGTINDETQEVVEENCPALPVLKSRISFLNAHTDPHLMAIGTTELSDSAGGKAKKEIEALWVELKKELK